MLQPMASQESVRLVAGLTTIASSDWDGAESGRESGRNGTEVEETLPTELQRPFFFFCNFIKICTCWPPESVVATQPLKPVDPVSLPRD